MKRESRSYGIGDVQVSRIDELTLNVFPFEGLYPGADPALLQRHRRRLGPGSFNSEVGVFTQSIHTWLVRTPRHTRRVIRRWSTRSAGTRWYRDAPPGS